jgi:soluble lytic murein transglycosylase-like protein
VTIAPVAEVVARIASIQTRFAPRAFAGALLQARDATAAAVAPAAPAAQPALAEKLPEHGRPWAGAIAGAATAAGIDPALLGAVVWAESSFDPQASSPAGARGLAQLMPGTARELGVDIDDPAANLAGGARYLRAQLDRFGDVELALAAYNAGPGRVAQAGGVPAIAETRAYVPRVLDYFARLQGAA